MIDFDNNFDIDESRKILLKKELPEHIAIIMDGNGRWAEKRGLNRIEGHIAGRESVRSIVTECAKLHIKYLTLYTFSTENWSRPKYEVNALMSLLSRTIKEELETMLKNNISFNVIGNMRRLPEKLHKAIHSAIEKTSHCTGTKLILALSYSGREEILDAVRHIIKDCFQKKIKESQIENFSENDFKNYLYAPDIPYPDLLIRTANEMRVSNFLLWQIAYTEIYVTDVLWPDFREKDLHQALNNYLLRERKFGKITKKN